RGILDRLQTRKPCGPDDPGPTCRHRRRAAARPPTRGPFSPFGDRVSSPASAGAQIDYPDKIDGAVLKGAGVVVLGAMMSILDITVVNVALPTFQTVFA